MGYNFIDPKGEENNYGKQDNAYCPQRLACEISREHDAWISRGDEVGY